jgi:endoglucanase
MFGIVNEPEENFDGALDEDVWQSMNDAVTAIRAVEDSLGTPNHIIAVQGTGGWSRRLNYYIDNPITAGGGENIAYEVHVYDPEVEFDSRFIAPSATLPIIIGEYGPAAGYMSEGDCDVMIDAAATRDIPHLAWTFHMRCAPNLLVDNSSGGCGVDMALQPTSWGQQLISWFSTPW